MRASYTRAGPDAIASAHATMLPASPASFVGRERERKRVARLWPKSRVVLLLGAGGIGKSALMRRLAEDLAGGTPLAGHRCDDAVHLLDGIEAVLRLPPLATSAQDRIQRIAKTLDAGRALLCLDDLHELPTGDLADMLTLAALLRTGHVLATSRRRIALGEVEASATIVEVGPLSGPEAEALVGELLDRVGRDGDAPAIARRAAGSPLWCRLLVGGADRVEERLERLLTGLAPPARALLEALSAFGAPVPVEWYEAEGALVRDLEARFLVERAEARLIVHDFVREVALASLPGERRRALELACAEAYGRRAPAAWAARLHHLEHAGDSEALERALSDGGATWLWAHRRLDDCVRLVDAALAGGRASPRLRLRQSLCYAVQGALAEARRAFELAGSAPETDAFLRDLAELTLLQEEGERASARQARYLRLLASAGPEVEPADLGQLANSFVRDCLVQGNLAAAFRVYADLERSPARIDELSRTRIARRLGDFLSEQGEGDAAARALASAEESAARLESPQLAAATHNCWVEHHVRYGDLVAAEGHLARADALPVPRGQTDTFAIRELRRAQVLTARGWLGRAAETLAASAAPPALSATTRCNLLAEIAAVAASRGLGPDARRAARKVLRVPRAQRPSVAMMTALGALARVEIARGNLARARRLASAMAESAWRATLRERAVGGLLLRAEATPGAVGRELLDAALALARFMGTRPQIAEALLLRGTRADAEQALEIAREIGAHLLAVRAELVLGWRDLEDGDDASAARRHVAARSAARDLGSRLVDAEVERLGLALRARGGSRRARAELDARLGDDAALPAAARDVLERVARSPRHAVTRAGRHPATAREAAPEAHDLWMDAASGAAVVDGTRTVDLSARPLLRRLLEAILTAPGDALDKERLFQEVWSLPYRPARDATLHKAVDRLARLLHPGDPKLFAGWDDRGRLVLRAARPCLLLRDAEAALNERQRWVVEQLERRPSISNRDLRAALGVPRATAQRDLDHLVTLGLVRREGKGRGTTYRR